MSSAAASAAPPPARAPMPAISSEMWIPTKLEHTVAEATRPLFEALGERLLPDLIHIVRAYATFPYPLFNELAVDLTAFFSHPLRIPKRHLPDSCTEKGVFSAPEWLDANHPFFDSCKLMMDVSTFGSAGSEDASLTLVVEHPQNRRRYVVQITKCVVPESLQGKAGYQRRTYRILIHHNGVDAHVACLIIAYRKDLISHLRNGDILGVNFPHRPAEELVYPPGFAPRRRAAAAKA